MANIRHSVVMRRILERFNGQVNILAKSFAASSGPGLYELSDSFLRGYDFRKIAFFIGSADISGVFKGELEVSADGTYKYMGLINLRFKDYFNDPYDIANAIPDKLIALNFFGDPYFIEESWVLNASGSGVYSECDL